MGAEALPKGKLSYEAYLQLEEQEDARYEYYDGEVVAMAGASLNHSRITNNITIVLSGGLENTPCEVFRQDVPLSYTIDNRYVYPNIMVTCNPEDIEAAYSIKRPNLIVEVLSPTTAVKDKGEKLAIYCVIPSLQHYLIVHQSEPYIEVYSRDKSLAVFQYREFQATNDIIKLPELKLNLNLT